MTNETRKTAGEALFDHPTSLREAGRPVEAAPAPLTPAVGGGPGGTHSPRTLADALFDHPSSVREREIQTLADELGLVTAEGETIRELIEEYEGVEIDARTIAEWETMAEAELAKQYTRADVLRLKQEARDSLPSHFREKLSGGLGSHPVIVRLVVAAAADRRNRAKS